MDWCSNYVCRLQHYLVKTYNLTSTLLTASEEPIRHKFCNLNLSTSVYFKSKQFIYDQKRLGGQADAHNNFTKGGTGTCSWLTPLLTHILPFYVLIPNLGYLKSKEVEQKTFFFIFGFSYRYLSKYMWSCSHCFKFLHKRRWCRSLYPFRQLTGNDVSGPQFSSIFCQAKPSQAPAPAQLAGFSYS